MKHLKFLSCLLLVAIGGSLPRMAQAQWVKSGYVVLEDALVRHATGSGATLFVGGAIARVEAYCTGTDAGTADISATFRVTWTWPGYGPSTGTSYTPKGTLTGSASTIPRGGALGGIIHHDFSGSSDTEFDGNPYASGMSSKSYDIPYGLFTYYDDIKAFAGAFQAGLAVPDDLAQMLPFWTGKKSRVCKVVKPKNYDASATHAESEVSFQ